MVFCPLQKRLVNHLRTCRPTVKYCSGCYTCKVRVKWGPATHFLPRTPQQVNLTMAIGSFTTISVLSRFTKRYKAKEEWNFPCMTLCRFYFYHWSPSSRLISCIHFYKPENPCAIQELKSDNCSCEYCSLELPYRENGKNIALLMCRR